MGCGASSPELAAQTAVSKDIEKTIKQDAKQTSARVKILLLGSGSSGKSTFAKQMKLLYMQGFSDKEAAVFADVICLNVLKNMKALVNACDKFEYKILPENTAAAQDLRALTIQLSDVELTTDRSRGIAGLWKDPAIQKCLERCNEFLFDDSAIYFFNHLDRISQENYKPSNDDILHLRARTIGIVETNFTYNKINFLMVDVGGQKNERKKWIHCFQDVTAIIFVVACSDYDLVLEEDLTTNRMADSIKLFNDVVNNKWFARTNVVLFLNKKDLFAEKINKVPLKVAFPEYTGANDYASGMAYILSAFKTINKSPADAREIFSHETCATDTQQVKIVFEAVSLTLLSNALEMGGFD